MAEQALQQSRQLVLHLLKHVKRPLQSLRLRSQQSPQAEPEIVQGGQVAEGLGKVKLKEARDHYYFFSGKTSDLVRQLGLGGIAIIWIFKQNVSGTPKIPDELVWPLTWIVIALGIDFLHYAVATVLWGNLQWRKEGSGAGDEEIVAPPVINWTTILFFSSKTLAISIAYYQLLTYLSHTLLP